MFIPASPMQQTPLLSQQNLIPPPPVFVSTQNASIASPNPANSGGTRLSEPYSSVTEESKKACHNFFCIKRFVVCEVTPTFPILPNAIFYSYKFALSTITFVFHIMWNISVSKLLLYCFSLSSFPPPSFSSSSSYLLTVHDSLPSKRVGSI